MGRPVRSPPLRTMGVRGPISGGSATIPDPVQMIAFSANPTGATEFGGELLVPTAAALEPTAACTVCWLEYAYDPDSHNTYTAFDARGLTSWSQWDTTKSRLVSYRNYGSADAERVWVVGMHTTGGNQAGPNTTVFTNAATLSLNAWHSMAFVFDGAGANNAARAKLAIDGAFVGTHNYFGTWPNALLAPGVDLRIGSYGRFDSGQKPFQGYMRRWVMWNSALSEAQLAAWHANPDDSSLPTPVASWRFSQLTGSTFTSEVGGYVATPTAISTGRAPVRAIYSLDAGYAYQSAHGATSGQRFDQADDGIASRITTYQPDIVVVIGGTNDAIAGDTGATIAAEYDAYVRAGHAAKTDILWICCTDPLSIASLAAERTRQSDANDILPTTIADLVADDVNAVICDLEAVTSDADIPPTDGRHQHEIGWWRIGLAIADVIAANYPGTTGRVLCEIDSKTSGIGWSGDIYAGAWRPAAQKWLRAKHKKRLTFVGQNAS